MTTRSLSQVLFSFLPDQTADVEKGVWRVSRWREPSSVHVADDVIRGELLRAITPWVHTGRDNGMADVLRSGAPIAVVSPSETGVEMERFPQIYRCHACHRVRRDPTESCACGARSWGQLHFVGYHDCGRLVEPFIPQCHVHNDVAFSFPGTTSARAIRFYCPVCEATVSQGFPFVRCECGNGTLKYNVHRAAVVYVPRVAVIVNPPNETVALQYRSDAAGVRVLEWALDGFERDNALQGMPTVETLVAQFVSQGVDEESARAMAEAAAAAAPSQVASSTVPPRELGDDQRAEATSEALRVAYATAGGRIRVSDLAEEADGESKGRFQELYPAAIAEAGLSAVELLPNFPVLTAAFGYTRGESNAGASSLRWFREGMQPRLHGYRANTEGLLFRLEPMAVVRWLYDQGLIGELPATPREARATIIRECRVPLAGDDVPAETAGSALLKLVHSLSHLAIRRISSLAGVDRESIAEYLVPLHGTFVVYAGSRGDFVLGGLQALFESNLEAALHAIRYGEPRCPLDPGCESAGGACVACLYLGEPSCRYYNLFLSRRTLHAPDGYLQATR